MKQKNGFEVCEVLVITIQIKRQHKGALYNMNDKIYFSETVYYDYKIKAVLEKDQIIKPLSELEYKTLEYLITNSGFYCSVDMILDNVWGIRAEETKGEGQLVRDIINRIREIHPCLRSVLETRRAIGYRIKIYENNPASFTPNFNNSENDFRDLYKKIYNTSILYRESIRNANQIGVTNNTYELQRQLRELYYLAELNQFDNKNLSENAMNIINQWNKYTDPYNSFSNCEDRMNEEGQRYAKLADMEFKKFVDMIVIQISDKTESTPHLH